MIHKIYRATILPLLTLCVLSSSGQTPVAVYSPDRSTVLEVRVSANEQLQYRMTDNHDEVVSWSALGLNTVGKMAIKKGPLTTHHGAFPWPLGEDDTITNNYNEQKISCAAGALPFDLIIRMYNGSAAFRYQLLLPEGSKTEIQRELTEFHLTPTDTIYRYYQESVFTPLPLERFTNTCDLPATVVGHDRYISIGEADNRQYTKAELKTGSKPGELTLIFPNDVLVKASGHFLTPWRTISVARTAIGLHAFSQLYLKLTPPPSNANFADFRPGKLIRAQLTTQSATDCIDFAYDHHFQYILFDAGWYGAQFQTTSDPTLPIEQIDMPRVIRYGKDKGIGVILYVNYVGLKQKLDTILPLYKKWGISGIKFGFVDGLTQSGISFLASAIQKATAMGFILDIHDNYKPTGLSRQYPALLTQEGIRGDENSPDAFHTTVLPYTRFLAGPADFTFCFPNPVNSYSKNIKVSKAQQLALTVIFFSPLQSMLWYGQPKDYTNEDEIAFFKYVPTVWNESRYLAGDIGKNISVARRTHHTWFIGNAAGLDDWHSHLDLDFLTPGIQYTATIFEDDGNGGIRKKTQQVIKGDVLPLDIPAKGGQAVMITPL